MDQLPFVCESKSVERFFGEILHPNIANGLPSTLSILVRAIHDMDPPKVSVVLPWLVRFGSEPPRLYRLGTCMASPRLRFAILEITDTNVSLKPLKMYADMRILREAYRYGPLTESNVHEWPRLAVSRHYLHLYHPPSRFLRVRTKFDFTARYNKHGLLGPI